MILYVMVGTYITNNSDPFDQILKIHVVKCSFYVRILLLDIPFSIADTYFRYHLEAPKCICSFSTFIRSGQRFYPDKMHPFATKMIYAL